MRGLQRCHRLDRLGLRDKLDEGEASVVSIKLLGHAHRLQLPKSSKELLDLLLARLERQVAHEQLGARLARRRCRLLALALGRLGTGRVAAAASRTAAARRRARGQLELQLVLMEPCTSHFAQRCLRRRRVGELDKAISHREALGPVFGVGLGNDGGGTDCVALAKERLQVVLAALEGEILDEERPTCTLVHLAFLRTSHRAAGREASVGHRRCLGAGSLGGTTIHRGAPVHRVLLKHPDGRPLEVERHAAQLVVRERAEGLACLADLYKLDEREGVGGRDKNGAELAVLGKEGAQLVLRHVRRQVLDEDQRLGALRCARPASWLRGALATLRVRPCGGGLLERFEGDAMLLEPCRRLGDQVRLPLRQPHGHRCVRARVEKLGLSHAVPLGHRIADGVCTHEEGIPVGGILSTCGERRRLLFLVARGTATATAIFAAL
mmetsp:Transcript_27008/g.68680  ORF Transcript_27008/g.68680 Transcript_27008/m.68680 type:complete len:438 (-) Transcript_27008:90-1403(-)